MMYRSKTFLQVIFHTFVKNAGDRMYQELRLAHHILCSATVFGVSLLAPVLSRIVLQHLAIKQ